MRDFIPSLMRINPIVHFYGFTSCVKLLTLEGRYRFGTRYCVTRDAFYITARTEDIELISVDTYRDVENIKQIRLKFHQNQVLAVPLESFSEEDLLQALLRRQQATQDEIRGRALQQAVEVVDNSKVVVNLFNNK